MFNPMACNLNFVLKLKIIAIIIDSLSLRTDANLTNDFIIDYFNFKKPSSVVGYTCNNMSDDVILMKHLNKNGFATTLNKLSNQSENCIPCNIKYYKVGVFLDTRCYNVNDIASFYLDATNQGIYGELHYWLILCENLTDVLTAINDDAFGLSTDLVIGVLTNMESFDLYDVYNQYKTRGYKLIVTFYGNWNRRKGLNVEILQTKLIRRSNLQGMPLKVIFFQASYKPKNMSFIDYFNEYRDVTKDARLKFGYFIVSHLSDLLNFTIEYVEAGKWAHGDGLGPLIRAVMNSSIDLTGSAGIMTNERGEVVKFVHQGWPYRTCFIFRNPQPKTIKIAEILRPFVDEVWFLMGFCLVTCIIILALTLKWDYHDDLMRISTSFIMTFGAMCQQCTEIEMNRISTRIAFFFILLFSLLTYNYYSASVVSARLDEPIFKINDSLAELGKLHMKMASEKMFYLSFYFALADKITKRFHEDYWFKIPESQQFMDPEIAMRLVQKGRLAYHVHPDLAYVLLEKYYDNREICELMEIHWIRPTDTMFAATKNCTFEEILKIGFTKITEVGLRRRQIKRWQYRKPSCHKNVLSASSINMYEFVTHLILLIVGALLALLVHSFEIMIFKQKIPIQNDFYDQDPNFVLISENHAVEEYLSS